MFWVKLLSVSKYLLFTQEIFFLPFPVANMFCNPHLRISLLIFSEKKRKKEKNISIREKH